MIKFLYGGCEYYTAWLYFVTAVEGRIAIKIIINHNAKLKKPDCPLLKTALLFNRHG